MFPPRPPGHCVRLREKANLLVQLGKHNISDPFESGQQLRRVSEIRMHPDFNHKTWDLDFALLKLTKPVQITEFVRTICLPYPSPIFNSNLQAIVTGFGYSNPDTMERPDILQFIRIPTWPLLSCGKFDPKWITTNMLCAGGDTKDACQVSADSEYF